MYQPTTRALAVLELLQTRGRMSGKEISERLEIDPRAVRRYISMLRDLGIPITAERGNTGAYVMGSGYKLPPMMFTNDESVALTLGLLAVRQIGLSNANPSAESALAKLERVMPFALRDQVRGLAETVRFEAPRQSPWEAPPGDTAMNVLIALSDAVRRRARTRMTYVAANNEHTARAFDPYGVALRQGKWYAVGFCHLRHDLRSFRLDRVESVAVTPDAFEPPVAFDPHAYLEASLRSLPLPHAIEVIIGAPLEQVRYFLHSSDAYFLEPHPRGTRLFGRTDELRYLVSSLAQFDCPVWPVQPAELAAMLLQHARKIVARVESQLNSATA